MGTKTFEQDGVVFSVEWVLDENPDTSYLGEYTSNQSDGWFIDRERGLLLGDPVLEPEEPLDFEEIAAYEAWLDEWDVWNNNYGREVLADVGASWNRNELRFYVPPIKIRGYHDYTADRDYFDDVAKPQLRQYNISVPDDDDVAGMTKATVALWCCQDYERMEDLNCGSWCFMGCVVTATVNGIEVGRASLWGIESDSDEEWKAQIEEGLVNQAKSNIPDTVRKLREAAEVAERFVAVRVSRV